MSWTRHLILALGLFPSGPAAAITLDYAAALQQAVDHNADLAVAGQEVEGAEGALLAARGLFDPTLSGSGRYGGSTSKYRQSSFEFFSKQNSTDWTASLGAYFQTGTNASLDWTSGRSQSDITYRSLGTNQEFQYQDTAPVATSRLGVSLSQALLQGHRMASNLEGVHRASRDLDQASLLREATRQQTLATAAQQYWSLWYQQRLVAIAEQGVAVAAEEQRVVTARVEQGALAPLERYRVDALLVVARSALLDAQNSARASADSLLLVLGEEPGQPVTLSTEPAAAVALSIDASAAVETALANNPTLRAQRSRVEGAVEVADNARHQRLPELNAVGGVGINGFDSSTGAAVGGMFAGDLYDWNVGAVLSVPLGNRADRGELQSASAAAGVARIELSSAERAVAAGVLAQVQILGSAEAKVQLARANLDLAVQSLAAQKALQASGRAIQKDVLEAIRQESDARVAVEKAGTDYQTALIELERLKGSL